MYMTFFPRKFYSIIAVGALMFGLSACHGNNSKSSDSGASPIDSSEMALNDEIGNDSAFIQPELLLPSDISTRYDIVLLGKNKRIFFQRFNPDPENRDNLILDNPWGIVGSDGKELIDGKISWIKSFKDEQGYISLENEEGYMIYGQQGKGLGVLNSNLKVAVPPRFDEITLCNDFAIGKTEGKQSSTIIYIPEDKILGEIDGKYKVKEVGDELVLALDDNDKPCFLDYSGNEVLSAAKLKNFSKICGFSCGLALVGKKDKIGFIDKTGRIVIPIKYEVCEVCNSHSYFKDGVAIVAKNGKYGVIDLKGKPILEFKYKWIDPFNKQGIAKAIATPANPDDMDTPVFLERSGNQVDAPRADDPTYWHAFNVMVKDSRGEMTQGPQGYKDSYGKERIPAKYIYSNPTFIDGVTLVRFADENEAKTAPGYNLIDSSGKILLKSIGRRSTANMPG